MPPPLHADLAELFADTVVVERPTAFDAYGKPTAFGPAASRPAYVVGRILNVRNENGQEQVSTVHAILNGAFDVAVRDRFTLPARFVPNRPKPIAVEHQSDENGAHHVTVYFQ